jgi:hypothetical protein
MISSQIFDHRARIRSYELLAEAMLSRSPVLAS